jgi:hypothetical protein
MTKKTLLAFSFIVAIVCWVYFYTYKAHRDISSEKADYVVTIAGLESEFESNDSLAYAKYQDKTIELTATISVIDLASKGILLGEKVFATFKDDLPKNIVSGKRLTIKGRFLGYDELLGEFKIDQSSVTQ